jgi:succinate-semialdehyde dehydrogenase/glutarate-semialdehyde dehydrogenase
MLIDGKPAGGASGKKIDVVNPATEEVIGCVWEATPAEVDAAVRSSAKAFKEWRLTPAADRANIMMKVIGAVRENADALGKLITSEVGKPFPQAKGEVGGFAAVMEYYAQEARRIHGSVLQSDHRDKFTYVLREPIGVVAAIPPWNDPLHLLSRMMGPALAAGCTVVAKPSSETPLATLAMADVAMKAGLPAGVLNVITGAGSTTGSALTAHALVNKIALTGSLEGGKQVMRAAADGIKRVTLELGGQSPCIVWEDADLEKVIESLTFQSFRSCGQVCNRTNRVYVHEKVYDQVVNGVAEFAKRVTQGDGFKDGVDIGPLVNAKQLAWVSSVVEDAVKKGAKVLTGGKRLEGKGFFYPPTVLGNCTQEMKVIAEETFGPVLGFVKVSGGLAAAIDMANDNAYGLAAYFFSRDQRNCFLAARDLKAGSVWINDIHGSYLQAPYGGMKQSGMGREQGSIAVDDYLEYKTVYQEMSYESRGARLCVRK